MHSPILAPVTYDILVRYWMNFTAPIFGALASILPTGAPCKHKIPSKCAFVSSNQTYPPINYHFGGPRRVSDKLLSDF